MHAQRPKRTRAATRIELSWLKKHWISILVISLAAAAAIAFVYVTFMTQPISYDYSVSNPNYKKPAPKYYSELTGNLVPSESDTKSPVTAVMIENSIDARPQSGLKEAGVVYETLAEGGVTRFMALYQQGKPELIGPVRSLRIYYLDWAAPYQASIAHVGGSPNALSEVRKGSYRDIDQYFNASTYWRSSDRYAPHNVYTSASNIAKLNANKNYKQSDFESFPRVDGKPSDEPNATNVTVNFSSALYNTSYAYDSKSNSYNRSLAGAPHKDREKGQISPKVVVVLKTSAKARGGADRYEDIVTTGSGTAYVFQNGTVTQGTWKKGSRSAPLRLVDSDGKDIELVRGQTWIGAITGRGGVSWK